MTKNWRFDRFGDNELHSWITMNLMQKTNSIGYEPYTDEFDAVIDISELINRDRAKEIIEFLTDYRLANIERPDYPKDPGELQILMDREKNEQDLLLGIPRGNGRRHLLDFHKATKDLQSRFSDEIQAIGIDPEQTAITFLIENSGATKGDTSYHIALTMIETCTALEALGIQTGVIGYTSRTYKGGSSHAKWESDGMPENPGRLDDLLHIVFKRPDVTMDDRGALGLYMIAEPKLKKENIFGEGLMWGAQAAASLDRPNKLLVHIANKPDSVSIVTLENDPSMKEKFREHSEAIVEEIDNAGEVAMSTVILAKHEYLIGMTQERRSALGRMLVVAECTGAATETLEAIFNGTTAAMERAMHLTPETKMTA